MIKDLLTNAEANMEKVIDNLIREYASLKAGRATPALLDRVLVDFYGTPTPINQTANISCPEPRLIVIQPWDKKTIAAIEKAIMKSDLDITPMSDGNVIRLNVPQLTEERRRELVKVCAKKAEDAKVAIRNQRRDLNDDIKALEKSKDATEDDSKKGLDDAQKLTDKFIKRIEDILQKKEAEIMEV